MTTSFFRFSLTKYKNDQWVEEGGHEHSKNMLLYYKLAHGIDVLQ